jgi:hypothetical protein
MIGNGIQTILGNREIPQQQKLLLDSLTDPVQLAVSMTSLSLTETMPYPPSLRMSGLFDVCVREYIIGHALQKVRKRVTDASMRTVFDIGSGIHTTVQNGSHYFRDILFGDWACLGCGSVVKLSMRPTCKCPNCGANPEAFIYREIELMIGSLSGHPDLYLLMKNSTLRAGEVKSIKKDDFVSLVAPLAMHEYQLTGYIEMTKRYIEVFGPLGKIPFDSSRGFLIYVSKEHPGKRQYPVKIFPVIPTQFNIDDIWNKVHLYDHHYNPRTRKIRGLPSPIDECLIKSWNGYRSTACPVKMECKNFYEKRERQESIHD